MSRRSKNTKNKAQWTKVERVPKSRTHINYMPYTADQSWKKLEKSKKPVKPMKPVHMHDWLRDYKKKKVDAAKPRIIKVPGGIKMQGKSYITWNDPNAPPRILPPVNPVLTKSQRRKAKRKAMGPRAPRKLTPEGKIRTPNDWPAKRLHAKNLICADCAKPLTCYARKLRNHKILFRGPDHKSVLYCLWFFQYLTRIDRQVSAYILFLAFSKPMHEQQRLRKYQFHAKCGCGYHLTCYQTHLAGASICKKHKKVFD